MARDLHGVKYARPVASQKRRTFRASAPAADFCDASEHGASRSNGSSAPTASGVLVACSCAVPPAPVSRLVCICLGRMRRQRQVVPAWDCRTESRSWNYKNVGLLRALGLSSRDFAMRETSLKRESARAAARDHGGLTEAHRPQRGVRPHEPHPTPFHSRGGSKDSSTGPTPITTLRMAPVNLLS